MENRSADDLTTAYHEAGHCLCYVLDDKAIDFTTINKDEDYRGRTKGIGGNRSYCNLEYYDNDINIRRAAKEKRITMLFSGGVSEKILNHSSSEEIISQTKSPLELFNGTKDENLIAVILNDEWNRVEQFDLIKRLTKRADERLRNNWKAVKALADELLIKRRLSENEVEGILNVSK